MGINTAIVEQAQLIGFAIPINTVKGVMGMLIIGKTERGWFGAHASPITAEEALELNYPESEGMLIKVVDKDSPAEQSGLQINDIITGLNKEPITSLSIFRRKLLTLIPGQGIHLTIFRDGKTFEITSTLARKKPRKKTQQNQPPEISLGLHFRESHSILPSYCKNQLTKQTVFFMTPDINPQIFREYDIRGVVGKDLTPETVQLIGQAIGTYLKRQGAKSLVLGWDVRSSSVDFRDILSKALTSTGCDVMDIGMVPTPVSYFALHHLKADGGVMITGSHNPPEFNGFKISQGQHSLYGKKIQELKSLIDSKDFETGSGKIEQTNILEPYMEHICSILNISRKVKVVVDGGNGCFGIVGPQLLRKLGLDPIEIFCEPDGTFPNHHPDPTVAKNLKGLIAKVRAENAELGIGFDGDADRIGIVDNNGNILWGDQLLTIFARDILSRNPGATIVGEVKCSQNLFQDIEKHGGVPVMAPAGHSLIKNKMKETGALLGGEMSGHVCFADNYFGYDDAVFAAGRILQIVAQSSQKVSEMLADLPETAYTPEIRIDCPDDKKFEIVRELTEFFKNQYDVIDIDGVRINFDNGWALIRASNTQPVLVLRFEAETQSRLEELVSIVKKQMDQYRPIVQFDHC